jgi:hypothetical protein
LDKNNYLFDKKKGKLFFTGFFLAREQKTVEKSFFFLSNMKFCFMKRPFYTAFDDVDLWRNQKAVQQ